MTIAVQIAPVAPSVTPIRAPVAAVATQITTVRPNIARFGARCSRITRPDILTPFAHVPLDVPPIAAGFAAVLAAVTPVGAQFALIAGGVGGLRVRNGRHAERQRQ